MTSASRQCEPIRTDLERRHGELQQQRAGWQVEVRVLAEY